MLRKHEIELIAGLVEGDLEDESEARALIASSAEARSEYEAQRVAFEALQSAGPVYMSDDERAALHRDVWTTLRSDQQPMARTTPWYHRIVPVAAALFVIVGLGAVLTQGVLNQESGDEAATAETFTDMSEGLSAEPTMADSEEADGGDDTSEAMSGDGDDAAADATDEESALVTRALDETFSEIARAVRTRRDMGDAATFRPFGAADQAEEAARCLESADLANYAILGEFEDPTDDETTFLVTVQSNDDIGPDTQVVFIDTATCQIAHIDG